MGGLMAFTVSAWVKLDAPAAAGVIIQQRPTDGLPPQFSESGQYQLSVTAAGTARFFCSGHSSMALNFTGLKNLNDGQWHHVAGVREANGDALIYLDGAVDASATSSGYIWPLDPGNSVGIGADVSDGSAYFKGSIDDVRIYNRALTTPETSALAQSSFTRGWSRAPWTGDASTGINLGSAWAYHFGAATNTAIQGRNVGGLTGTSPAISGSLETTAVTASITPSLRTPRSVLSPSRRRSSPLPTRSTSTAWRCGKAPS